MPIRPAAARLPPSKVVLCELGRPTAFSARPPVPAPSTPARGAGTRPSGATAPAAGGARDSDAVGGPCAADAGYTPTGRRAENDGAGAVAGWLAGLGLGRYTEALLGAGWDCAEVGAARAPPQPREPRAALCSAESELISSGRGGSNPLSAVEIRPPRRGQGFALPPSRHPLALSVQRAALSPNSNSTPVSGQRPRASPCIAAPLTAEATWSRAGGGRAAGGGPAAARGAARARAAHRRARPVPPPRRCCCHRQP